MSLFAEAEAAVSNTLLTLSAIAPRGTAIRLPQLVGQRFEALANAVAPNGPFHADGKPVATILVAFRNHDALRNALCHATGTITLDRTGDWHIILKLLAARAGKAERSILVFDRHEAEEAAQSLDEDVQRLSARLARFCTAVAPGATGTVVPLRPAAAQ